MRTWILVAAFGCSFGLGPQALQPSVAHADVPRSCVHPQADPLACARDTREVTHRVLPSARLRALRQRRRAYERVAPLEDRERNRTLESIDSRVRCSRC